MVVKKTFIDKKTADKILSLRTQKVSLAKIMDEVSLSYYAIRNMLKKELGDDYGEYCVNVNRPIRTDEVEKILELARRRKTQQQICEELNRSSGVVKRILTLYLGNEYDKLFPAKSFRLTREHLRMINELDAEGKSVSQICKALCVPVTPVSIHLRESFLDIFERIMSGLNIPHFKHFKPEAVLFYQQVFNEIRKGSRYRNPSRLAPTVIYFFLKMKCVQFRTSDFLASASLSREEFRKHLKNVIPFCPKYADRDRENIIRVKIFQVIVHFKFNSTFYQDSEALLNKFLPFIKNTIEEVSAAVICILTMIKLDINTLPFTDICRYLGIEMSAASYQVKHKILKKLNINGFKGLRRSSGLIKSILNP